MTNRIKKYFKEDKPKASKEHISLIPKLVETIIDSSDTTGIEDVCACLSAALWVMTHSDEWTESEAMDKLILVIKDWKEKGYHEDQQG